ncbi:MAG TPA: hypothetical protein VMJ92_04325 [Candidatus Limnocylindrales bacterium]|nr:hypothetical protein [Candidatus Limnocylindrales bacterium]
MARARAVAPTLALHDQSAASIAAICVRLDGLPLALELAAARARALPARAILDRLDRVLDVVAEGPRDAPARHRTLRAAIRWSYELLDPDLRALFRRLSVFAGGCDPAAVAAISGAEGAEAKALDACASLGLTIEAANIGPSRATGVTLTDTLPSTVTLESATSTQGDCTEAEGTVTCNLGALAKAASATVTITVTPRGGGTVTNTASVVGNEPDPNTANNAAATSTSVHGPPEPLPECAPSADAQSTCVE